MIRIVSEEEAHRRLLFADNLRYIMRTKKLSTAKVASRMGISPSTVSTYATGKQFPDEAHIYALARALRCSVDDLFDDSYVPWIFGADGIKDKEKYKDLL